MKRPFAGAMDFEDFLAAHLDQDITLDLSDSANSLKAAGMIYQAILKRKFFRRNGSGDFTAALTAEEMLGGSRDPVALSLATNLSAQQQRFAWFRAYIDSADPKNHTNENNALLSLQAFNEIATHLNRKGTSYHYSFYSKDPFEGKEVNIPAPTLSVEAPPAGHALAPYEPQNLTPKLLYPYPDAGRSYSIADLQAWYPTNTSGQYAFYAHASDDLQVLKWLSEGTFPPSIPQVDLITSGLDGRLDAYAEVESAGGPATQDTLQGNKIVDEGNPGDRYVVNSCIHGPLRVYQHTQDLANENTHPAKPFRLLAPAETYYTLPLAFHSRYFKVFVLARSLDKRAVKSFDTETDTAKTTIVSDAPVPGSERRIEFVYDAESDRVLTTHRPLTEKRNIGDPSFPEDF
jgi:hypothetical protein